MEGIWQWGLALIIAIQSSHGPVLDGVFRAITFLGEEEFYLLLFPTLLWCVDARLGLRLGIIFLLSVYVNSLVKDLAGHPRPFELNPTVKLADAEGYGLPSGHAQSAVVVWGGMAAWVRKPAAWIAAGLLAGAIGFSRIYLGVHFPTDVLVGWGIGAVLLAVALAADAPLRALVREWPLPTQVVLATVIPAVFAIIFPVRGTVSALGALAGVGVGFAFSVRHLSLNAAGPWWQRVARFVVGAIALIALYIGPRLVLPSGDAPVDLVFRFLRYAVLGLWISLGAPWLFDRLHLVSPPPQEKLQEQ